MAQEKQLLTSAVNWFGFAELTEDYDISATTNSSESADTPVTTISHETPTSTHRIDENEVVVPILSEKSGKTKYKVLARQKAEEDEIAQTTKNTVCDKSMGLKVAEQRKGNSETVHSVKVIESKKTVAQKKDKFVKKLKITPDKARVKLHTGISDTPTGKTDLCIAGERKKTVKKQATTPVGTGNEDSKSKEVKHLKRRKSDIVKISKVNQGDQIKKVNDKEAKIKSVPETKNVSDNKEQDQNEEVTMKKVPSDLEVIEIDKAKVDLTEMAKLGKAVQKRSTEDEKRTKQIKNVTETIEKLEENRSVSHLVPLGNSENIPNNTESIKSESVNVEEENSRKSEKALETENETVVTADLTSIITRAIIEVSPCVSAVSKCSVALERDPSIDNLHLGTNDISDPHMKSNLYKRKLSDSGGNVTENGKQTMSPHSSDTVSSITDFLNQVSVKRQKSTEEKLKVDMVYDADIDVRKSGRLKSAKCASRYRGDYGIRSDTYSKIASRKTESPVNGEHISDIETEELNRTWLNHDDFKGDSVDGLVSMETDSERTGIVEVNKPNMSNPFPSNVIHRKRKQLNNETMSSPEQDDCVEMYELEEQEKSQLVLLNKLDNSTDIDFEMNALDVECAVSEVSSENSQSNADTSSCEPCSTSDGREESLNSSIASSETSGILEHNSLVPCQTDNDSSGQCNCDKLLELHQTLNSAQKAELVLTSVEMDNSAHICNVSDSDKVNSVDQLTVSSKSGYVHSVGKSVNKKQNYLLKKSSKTTQNTEMCSMVLSPESSPEKCDPIQVLERLRHKMFENVGLSAQVDVKPKSFESKLISSKLKRSKQGSNSMDEPLNSNVIEHNETTQVPSEANVPLLKTPTRCSTPSSSASSCPSILEEVAKTLNSMSKTKRKNESKDVKPKRKRRRFEEKKFTLRSMSRSDNIAKDSNESTHETENVLSVKLDESEYDDHLFPFNDTDAVKLKKSNEIKKKQNRVKSRKKSIKHKATCDTIHENLNKGGEILDLMSNDAAKDNTDKIERQQDVKVVKKKPKNVKCHSCCQTFRSKELMRKHYPCRVRQTRTWSQIKLRPTRAFRNDTLQRRRQADFQSKLPKSNKQSNKPRPQLLMQRKTKFRRVKGKRRRKLYQSIQLLINKRKVRAWPHLNVLFPDLSFKEQYLYRLGLFCVGNNSEGLENYSGEDLTLFQKHKDKENENYLARNFKHIFPSSDEESEDATNDAKHSKPETCDITHVPNQVDIQDSNGSQTELQSSLNTSASTCDSDVTVDPHLIHSKCLNKNDLKTNCDINDRQSRPTALAKTEIQEIEGPLSKLDMNIDKQAIVDEIIENVLHSVFENIFENDRKRKVNCAISDSAAKGKTSIDNSSTYGVLRDTMLSVHEGEIETTSKSDDNNHSIPMEDNSDLLSDPIQNQALNVIPSEHCAVVDTGLNNILVPTSEISGTQNLVKEMKSDLNASVSHIVNKDMLSTSEEQIIPSYSNINEPNSRLCYSSEPASFHPKTLRNIAGVACSFLGIKGKLEITKPSENDTINSRDGVTTQADEEVTTDVALSVEEVCQQKADGDLNSTGMVNEVNFVQTDEVGIKSVYAFSTKENFVADNDSYYTPETVLSERGITEESCVDKTAAEFESHESNDEKALENKENCFENIDSTLEHPEEQQSIVEDHATGIETSDMRTENIEEENEISVTDFIERFYQKSLEIETAIHAYVNKKSGDIDENLKDKKENIQYELPASEKAVKEESKMFQEPVTNETKTFIVQQLNEIVSLVESDLESETRSLYHNNSEDIINRIPVITTMENNTEPNGSVISPISNSIESGNLLTEDEIFELDSNTVTIYPKPNNSLSYVNYDNIESTKSTRKSKDVIELAIDTFIYCEKDVTENVSDKEDYPSTYVQCENNDTKSIVDKTVYAGTDLSCKNYNAESVSDNASTDLQSENDIKSVSEEADKISSDFQHEKDDVENVSDMAVTAAIELQCANDIKMVSNDTVNAGTDLQHRKDSTVGSFSNRTVNEGKGLSCKNNIERVSNKPINEGTDLQHEKRNVERVSYKAGNSGTDLQCESNVESISDESVNAYLDLQCENDIKIISDGTSNALTDLGDNFDLERVSDKAGNDLLHESDTESVLDEAVNAGTKFQCESDVESVLDEAVYAGTNLQCESDIESDSDESVSAVTELQCENHNESISENAVNATVENGTNKAANSDTQLRCENEIENNSEEAVIAGTDFQHENGNVENVLDIAVSSGTDIQCENNTIENVEVNAGIDLAHENQNVEIVSDTNISLSSEPMYEHFEKEVCVSEKTSAPLCDTLDSNHLEENIEGNDLVGSEADDETCDLKIQTCSSPYIGENRTKTPAVIKYTINGVFISENLETGIKEIIADESCETDIQFGNTSQESSEMSKDEDVLHTSVDSADIAKEVYDSENKEKNVEDDKELFKMEELLEKINNDKDILNNKFEWDNTGLQKERTNSTNFFIDKTLTEKEKMQDLTDKENRKDSANIKENKLTRLSTDSANIQFPAINDSEEIEVMRHSDDVYTTFEKENSTASLSVCEIIETQVLPVDRNDLTGPFKVLEKDMDISFIIKPETPPILEKVIGDESDDKEQEHFGHENSQLSESDPPVLEPAKKPRSERHFLDVLGEICESKAEVEKDVCTIEQMPKDIEVESDTELNSPESLKDFDENISFNEDVGRHFSDVIDCSRPEPTFSEVRLLLHKSENGEVTLSQIKSLFKPESKKGSPIPKDKLLKIRTGVQSIVSKVKLPQKKDPVWLKRNSLFDYSDGAEEAHKYKLAKENWSIDDSEMSENDPSPQKVSKIDNNNKIQIESDTTAGSISNNILQMLTSLEDKGSFANNMTNLLDILAENLGFQRSSIGKNLEISDENDTVYTRVSNLSCNEINKNMIDGDLDELDEPPPLDEIPIADDFYVFEESSPSRILNRCNISSDKELSLSPTVSSLSNISNPVHQREEEDNVGITSQHKNAVNNDVNPENVNESEADIDDKKETEDSVVEVSETLNNLKTDIESVNCDHCEISGQDISIQNNVEDVSAFHQNLNFENNSKHVDQSTTSLSIPSQNSSKAHTIFKSITELNSIETDEDSDSRETFDVVTISHRISDLKSITKDDLEPDEHSDTELEVPTVCDSPTELAASIFESDGSQGSSNEFLNGINKLVKGVDPVFDKDGADKESDDIVPTCSSIETDVESSKTEAIQEEIISADEDEEEGDSSDIISEPLHNLETNIESADIIHDERMEIHSKVDPTVEKEVEECHNSSCKTKSNQDVNIQHDSFQTLNLAIEREDKQYEIDNGDLIEESKYVKLIDSLEIASTNLIDRNKKEQIDTEHDNQSICPSYESEIQCADQDQERLIECNNLVPDNQSLGCSEDRGVIVENNRNSCLTEIQEKGAKLIPTECYQNAVELKSFPNISVQEETISDKNSAEIEYDDESEETHNLKTEIDSPRDQRNTQQESKANSDFQSWTAEESAIYSNQNSSDSMFDTHENISETVDFESSTSADESQEQCQKMKVVDSFGTKKDVDNFGSKSCLSDVSTALEDESGKHQFLNESEVNINNEINVEASKEREISLNELKETAENKDIIGNDALTEINKAPVPLEEITVDDLNIAATDDDSSSVCSEESIEISNAIDNETRHTLADNTIGMGKMNEFNDNKAANEVENMIPDGKMDQGVDPSVFEKELSEDVSKDTDKNKIDHTYQSQNECNSADQGKVGVTDNIVNDMTEELEQTSSCEHNSPFREISSADETNFKTETNCMLESQYLSTSVNEDADSNTSQNSQMNAYQIVSNEMEEEEKEDQFESEAEDSVEQVDDQFESETEIDVEKAKDQFESEAEDCGEQAEDQFESETEDSVEQVDDQFESETEIGVEKAKDQLEDGVGQGNENIAAERLKEETVKQNLTDGGDREISTTDVESSQDIEATAGDSELKHNMKEHVLEKDTEICDEEKEAKSQVSELNQPENFISENKNNNGDDFVTSEIGNGEDIIDDKSQVEVGLNQLETSESENEIEEKPSEDVSKFSSTSHVHVENMSCVIIRERFCDISSRILEGDDELRESQKLQNVDTNAENIKTEDDKIVANSKSMDTDLSHLNAYCESRKATVCSENAINPDKMEKKDITTDGDSKTIENSTVNLNTFSKRISAVEIVNEENEILSSDEDSNHTVAYGNEHNMEPCDAKDNNGSSTDQTHHFYQEALNFNQAFGNSNLFQEEFCETIAETVKRKQNERQIKMDQARSKYRSYFPGPQLPKSKQKEFSIFRTTMLQKKAERVRQKSVGCESGENKMPQIRNRSTSVPKDIFINPSLLAVNLQPVKEVDNRQKIDVRPCIVKLKRLSEKTLERYRKRSNHQANRPPIRFKINLTNFCIKPCSPRPAYLSDAASDNSNTHEESESEMSDESSDGCSGSHSVQSTESEPWMQSAEHRIYEIKHSPRAFYRGLDEEKPIKIRVKSVKPVTNEVDKNTNEKNERSLFGTFDDVRVKNVPSLIGNVEQPSVNDGDKDPLNPKWVTELQLSDSDTTEFESDQDEENSINGGSTSQSVSDTLIESQIEETTATEHEHSNVVSQDNSTCIHDHINIKAKQEQLKKDHEMNISSADQVDGEKLAKDKSDYQICEDDEDILDNVGDSLNPIFDEVDGSVEKCIIDEDEKDLKNLQVAVMQEEKAITNSQEIVTDRTELTEIELNADADKIVTYNLDAKYPVSTEPALKIDVSYQSLDNKVLEEKNSKDQQISFDISETEKQETIKGILEQESSLEIDSRGNVTVQNETTPGPEININESRTKYNDNEIILIQQKARVDKHLEINQTDVEKEPEIFENGSFSEGSQHVLPEPERGVSEIDKISEIAQETNCDNKYLEVDQIVATNEYENVKHDAQGNTNIPLTFTVPHNEESGKFHLELATGIDNDTSRSICLEGTNTTDHEQNKFDQITSTEPGYGVTGKKNRNNGEHYKDDIINSQTQEMNSTTTNDVCTGVYGQTNTAMDEVPLEEKGKSDNEKKILECSDVSSDMGIEVNVGNDKSAVVIEHTTSDQSDDISDNVSVIENMDETSDNNKHNIVESVMDANELDYVIYEANEEGDDQMIRLEHNMPPGECVKNSLQMLESKESDNALVGLESETFTGKTVLQETITDGDELIYYAVEVNEDFDETNQVISSLEQIEEVRLEPEPVNVCDTNEIETNFIESMAVEGYEITENYDSENMVEISEADEIVGHEEIIPVSEVECCSSEMTDISCVAVLEKRDRFVYGIDEDSQSSQDLVEECVTDCTDEVQ